jgi:TonB family protein
MMNAVAEFAWKSTVVLTAAFAVNYALRRGSAAVRHFVWTTALAILLPMAMMIGIGPRWIPMSAPVAAPVTSPAVTHVRAVTTAPAPKAPAAPRARFEWIYLAGVTLVLTRFAIGIGRTGLLMRRSRNADHAMALIQELRDTLRISRPVRALAGSEIAVPMAWGIVRPVALLPESSDTWSTARMRTVLLHELTHIKRHDLLAQILAQAACCAFWFHPLVWLAARELRKERERACDDAVLNRGVGPAEYAGHLMELARSLAARRSTMADAPAMAETSDLELRVRALLDRRCNRAPLTRRIALTVAAMTCALVLPMATLTTYAQAGRGALAGVVKDPSGSHIPRGSVTAKNLDGTNVESTKVDMAGEYGFPSIPAGRYEIEARVPGFAIFKTQVVVTAGTAARADLNMELGSVSEAVTVRGTRTTPAQAQSLPRAPQRIPIGGAVEPAKVLKQVKPVYPEELKAQGIAATVMIKAIISKEGNLLSPRVVNTVDPALAQAALDAVKQWQYSPTLLNGHPVEVITTIDVTFELDK